MDVSPPNESQSRYLAQKKQELVDEENSLLRARANAERDRLKAAAAENDKTERTLVEISRTGAQQVENAKAMNEARVKNLSVRQQQNFDELAKQSADRLQQLGAEAKDMLAAHASASARELLRVEQRSEDPFYRITSLSPDLSESEHEYTVRVPLAAHEAENLLVTGEGQALKLTLARHFQDHTDAPTGDRTTRTSSYMSIVDKLLMPGPFDLKKVSREYRDGAVLVHVPKVPKPSFVGPV